MNPRFLHKITIDNNFSAPLIPLIPTHSFTLSMIPTQNQTIQPNKPILKIQQPNINHHHQRQQSTSSSTSRPHNTSIPTHINPNTRTMSHHINTISTTLQHPVPTDSNTKHIRSKHSNTNPNQSQHPDENPITKPPYNTNTTPSWYQHHST